MACARARADELSASGRHSRGACRLRARARAPCLAARARSPAGRRCMQPHGASRLLQGLDNLAALLHARAVAARWSGMVSRQCLHIRPTAAAETPRAGSAAGVEQKFRQQGHAV